MNCLNSLLWNICSSNSQRRDKPELCGIPPPLQQISNGLGNIKFLRTYNQVRENKHPTVSFSPLKRNEEHPGEWLKQQASRKKNRADSSDLHPTASYEEIKRVSPHKRSLLTISNKIFWLGPDRFHPPFFKRNRIKCSQRLHCPPHCRVLQQIWIPNAITLIKRTHSWLNIFSNVEFALFPLPSTVIMI